jgi:hypothetical protein
MNIPQPKTLPQISQPKFGFSRATETLNGRAAMVGFGSLLIIELFTGSGLLTLLGLR